MDTHEQVQQLIQASAVGNHSFEVALAQADITLPLIESLKKEVDRYVRSDLRQALHVAELTHRLSTKIQDPLARALGVRAKAQTLHYLHEYADAVALYEEASAIYRTLGKSVEAARMTRSMIDPLMYLGRYDAALALADDARQILIANAESTLLAQLETNVGNVHHRLDQYHEALRCYEKAHAVFAANNDPVALAVVSYNLGNIHVCLDDFRQAQNYYEKAFALHSQQQMDVSAMQVRYSLGYLHFLKGQYHQAMSILHEAQPAFAELGDQKHVALCQLDLAEICLQLHILEDAARYAEQARAGFLTLGIRYEAAKALSWQGLAQLQQGNLSQAAQSLRTAQTEFAAEGNEVFLGLIDLYLAELSLQQQQPKAALLLAANAQALFARLHLKAKHCYAQFVVAKAFLQDGQTEQAQTQCETVLGTSLALNAPWLSQQAHELLGDLWLAQGDETNASEQYTQAVHFIEQMRGSIRVDEFRSAFFKDKLRVYEKLIRLHLAQDDAEKQAKAFYYLESRKARTLVDLLINELETAPTSDNPATQELYARWQQLREELHWYYSKVNQNETGGKSRLLAVDEKLREEIRQRESALIELTKQAQLQDPDFVWLRNVSGLRVEELRAALAADEAVIEYYLNEDRLTIFLVDAHDMRVIQTTTPRAELKQLIFELKFQMEKFHYGPAYLAAHLERLQNGTDACLHELYQLLFAPVASFVENKKLIFIPFDLLHNVPFQALYDGKQYLLERHEIAAMPSAQLLALCARKTMRIPGRALIFGGADEFAPKITEEIDAIQKLFPAAHCFVGAQANLPTLAKHLPASDVIHIASHAVFRQDNPMFSAFKLAGTWLNFYDVCSLRISSALVTLSGCSTGTNRIYAGDEILGLVRGFLSAGAAALVVSQWAVNDSATASLMNEFYRRLQQGLPPRASLREAALAIKEQYQHPYYWAPFVFIGHTNKFADGGSPGALV